MGRKSNLRKIKRDNSASQNIEAALIMNLYEKGHSPITSHFTGAGLSECDVLSVSKADYIYEYEVKISRSDFKKDFLKEKHQYYISENYGQGEQYNRPNYFYYVTPTNLLNSTEIPAYAGLIEWDGLSFNIIIKAPLTHKRKASSSFIRQISHQLSTKLIFKKIS